MGARLNENFLRLLAAVLLNYELEFGYEDTQAALLRLSRSLIIVGDNGNIRWMKACYLINLSFNDYYSGKFSEVPTRVLQALFYNPKYITNRGVLAILIRSIGKLVLK